MAKLHTAVFERREKKFRLDSRQYQNLQRELGAFAQPDQYGQYTICNVYYDTDDYALIRHSLDKPAFKQKLRLRSYGVPGREDLVYLELKKKLDGITYKRRITMPLCGAEEYLHSGGALPEHTQISAEIDWFVQQNPLTPKVVLCYDRAALRGIVDPELRITFDSGIRWRDCGLHLWQGDGGEALLPDGTYIMEIKTRSALPCPLARLLAELQVYPCSFSKYGAVYKQLLSDHREVARRAG